MSPHFRHSFVHLSSILFPAMEELKNPGPHENNSLFTTIAVPDSYYRTTREFIRT